MIGKAIKYDEKNINTDLIIPARYLVDSNPDHLAGHCMEDLDPDFIKRKEELDAKFIVSDSNFGCGSSREQAPISIKAAGIQAVIAPSFARIFYRNAINIGLPIIEFDQIALINTGDKIEIDFDRGLLKNLTNDQEFEIKSMPDFIQDIISVDGLINFARNQILKNVS